MSNEQKKTPTHSDQPEWTYFAEALAHYPGRGLTGAQVMRHAYEHNVQEADHG